MSVFAPVVSSKDRAELEQIFITTKPNYLMATKSSTYLYAIMLQFLDVNFTFKCVAPAEAPDNANLCTSWQTVLES